MHRITLIRYLKRNTSEDSKNCVCGPVSTVPLSLSLRLSQDYGFLLQYKGIHEILHCNLEQKYLNKFSCFNPSYAKVFVLTHTLYPGGLAQDPLLSHQSESVGIKNLAGY